MPTVSRAPLPAKTEQAIARAVTFLLDPVPWITGKAEKLYVSEMTGSHIQHTITMIRSKKTSSGVPFTRITTNGLTNVQWIQIFEDELIRRAYLAFNVPDAQ